MPYFEINILVLFILFGALQGFILAFILISTKRLNKTSNQFLALLLFNLSLLNVSSALELIPTARELELLRYIPTFFVNLIPVFTYYFVHYLIEPKYTWRKVDYLVFIPSAIELTHRFYRFFSYLAGYPYSQEANQQFYFISNVYEAFAVIATLVVIFYSLRKLSDYEKKLYENYAEVSDKSLSWLWITLVIGLLLAFLWLFVTYTDFDPILYRQDMAINVLLGLSMLIYWIGYSMIIRQGLLDTPTFAVTQKEPVQPTSSELSVKTTEHYTNLLDLMTREKVYRNPNLSMTILADKMNLSNGYLSQIINQKEEQNFFDFVNSYRVEEVKLNMADPKFDHFTILGLAQEAGFKSKSTFNSVFKKLNGVTPSQYKKQL